MDRWDPCFRSGVPEAPDARLRWRMETSTDHLLNGRVLYRQPKLGFRAAIDPVLLAAAIPAAAGDRVLEGGTGAGAALLCLATRVSGVIGTGIERDIGLLRLAADNAAANGLAGLSFVAGDLTACPVGGVFDHAFANPPYHAAHGTASGIQAREAAKRADVGTIGSWTAALAAPLRARGTLTLILPPHQLEAALIAFRAARVPAERVVPIWTRLNRPARWVIVQGRKFGRAGLVLAPALILHAAGTAWSPSADAILRQGWALDAALALHTPEEPAEEPAEGT